MKKRLLSIALVLCMLVSLLPAAALADNAPIGGSCGKSVTWALKDGTLTISGIRHRLYRAVVGVIALEHLKNTVGHSLVRPLRDGTLYKQPYAVADKIAHLVKAPFGEIFRAQSVISRIAQILERIEQRAVKIKNYKSLHFIHFLSEL